MSNLFNIKLHDLESITVKMVNILGNNEVLGYKGEENGSSYSAIITKCGDNFCVSKFFRFNATSHLLSCDDLKSMLKLLMENGSLIYFFTARDVAEFIMGAFNVENK